ncbi:site-specific tyrosine recombinase XerD [bacterium]|nr:site-specific tyrosine recombinase XerD [bacterium]
MPPRKRPSATSSIGATPTWQPGAFLAGFSRYLQAECGLAENTVTAYGRDLQRFSEWYNLHGPSTFRELKIELFTRYLEHLHAAGLAASSMARHLVSIKMYFRYLMLEGLVAESVVDLVNSPKLWQHLPKVLSPDMVDRLLAAPSRNDRWPLRDRALLALLYATGCRASEVCRLTVRDVQLEAGYCRCLGKGNKERIVSLNPVAVAAVSAYLEHERPQLIGLSDPDRLLVSRRGTPLSRITVWKLIKRYAARIGASDGVSPHTLRHSFATHMLAGGAEIRALQELLGHASVQTTQIYTHVDHSRIKAVHERCHPRG